MSKWYQIIIPRDYPIDHFLNSPHFLGSVEKEDVVIAYFEKNDEAKALLEGMDFSVITEDDWEEKWKEYFRPIDFAGFKVVPPWLKEQGNLIINPARGFGTGHHETTALAAELMTKALNNKDILSMIDIGTGSGILAVAAKKINPAITVTAVDNDTDALENALENLELNGLEGKVKVTDTPLNDIDGEFDLVVANIISSTLLELSDEIKKKTKKYLVLSGILEKEKNLFITNMSFEGFSIIENESKGEWTGFLILRKNG